ncbi:MAG: plasmid recombination protein [Acutalibacteraceae bacterium]|nr:plasmid recombination protein [Acutalibacteraceae bacterium]
MVGKGSVNHNSRKFKAENVDANRTHLNISYCNKDIRKVYDDLFGEALKRYNNKQKRADRKIDDYYEKICNSKQEKPFYEIILQIGDKDNMSSLDENGELAKKILDNYFDTFEERNPYLKVFSAHLHMDEATPHLHIDFVPFTTGSKRGLDTRVSLKQALAEQGFTGGTRSDTEWNQWVSSEKSALAFFMKEHGIEWEQKGTHEKHLSVLDFKKQERTAELEKLESEIAEKKDEFEMYQDRIDNFTQGYYVIDDLAKKLDTEPDYQLQEPTKLMSAKSYKTKFVEPLIKKLREVIEAVFALYYQALDSYHRLNMTNKNLYRENQYLSKDNDILHGENTKLKEQNKDYRLLRKVFGDNQIDNLLEQARNSKAQKRDTRTR